MTRERVHRWSDGRAEAVLDGARLGAPGWLVSFRLHPAGYGPSIVDPGDPGLEEVQLDATTVKAHPVASTGRRRRGEKKRTPTPGGA